MIFGSVCSGIEAASRAWMKFGWKPAWFSEIEPFPSAVLKHHYPETPNLGDMTKLYDSEVFNGSALDVLVGGTPCQSFSIAGLRKGLADPRGNLALHFLALLDRKRPKWVVWENVPGVLSSWSDEAVVDPPEAFRGDLVDAWEDGSSLAEEIYGPGRERDRCRGALERALALESFEEAIQSADFDTFTSGLRELGYDLAWRVLDAQYFGVPQRRQRVFVVGHLGDWRPAAAVLFESYGLSGHPAPSRETRTNIAGPVRGGSKGQGGSGTTEDLALIAGSLNAKAGTRLDPSQETFAIQERAVSENLENGPGGKGFQEGKAYTLEARHHVQAVAYDMRGNGDGKNVPTLTGHHAGAVSDFSPMVFESRFARNGRGAPDEIVPPLKAQSGETGKGDGAPLVFSLMPQNSGKDFKARQVEVTQPLMAGGPVSGNQGGDVVFQQNSRSEVREIGGDGQIAGAVTGEPGAQCQNYLKTAAAVRRLTPRECERLQGFPDDYTLIPYRGGVAADGPRYKACGNSMAVVVMEWIGHRIETVAALLPKPTKRMWPE